MAGYVRTAIDFLLRHRRSESQSMAIFIGNAIEDTQDPGQFRNGDIRRIEPGENGIHAIVASVFSNSPGQWSICVSSEHSTQVQYFNDLNHQWGEHSFSDIFDYTAEGSDRVRESSLDLRRQNTKILGRYVRDVQFKFCHIKGDKWCPSIPHELYSKILFGGFHSGTTINEAQVEIGRESGRLKCR